MEDTEKSLARRAGDAVLEKRVKRLRKAVLSLLDTTDPNTWQVGNLEIDSAMKVLGLSGGPVGVAKVQVEENRRRVQITIHRLTIHSDGICGTGQYLRIPVRTERKYLCYYPSRV